MQPVCKLDQDDADIPGQDLVIYHIDENLPEGQRDDVGQDWWHLRASLVEADDDFLPVVALEERDGPLIAFDDHDVLER